MPATRYLYLARHAQSDHEHGDLTAHGRRQARLLGQRLRQVGVRTLHHGPLPRTAQTAHLVAQETRLRPTAAPEAGDYVPHVPAREQLPPEHADTVMGFIGSLPAHEHASGPDLAQRALERFTGPVRGQRNQHQAVITHAYLVSWLLCQALGAPAWRWVTLAPHNAALTIVRYAPDRAASVLVFNDTTHLGTEQA